MGNIVKAVLVVGLLLAVALVSFKCSQGDETVDKKGVSPLGKARITDPLGDVTPNLG